MVTTETLKSQAKRLRTHLERKNLSITHSQALEAIASVYECKDWNTAAAKFQSGATSEARETVYITAEMSIDDVREDVKNSLLRNPAYIRLRLDGNVTFNQHRQAHVVAREIEELGIKAEVDV